MTLTEYVLELIKQKEDFKVLHSAVGNTIVETAWSLHFYDKNGNFIKKA